MNKIEDAPYEDRGPPEWPETHSNRAGPYETGPGPKLKTSNGIIYNKCGPYEARAPLEYVEWTQYESILAHSLKKSAQLAFSYRHPHPQPDLNRGRVKDPWARADLEPKDKVRYSPSKYIYCTIVHSKSPTGRTHASNIYIILHFQMGICS